MRKIESLPGVSGWECWSVSEWGTRWESWHGRPVGSPIAVVHADTMQALTVAAVAWLGRPESEIDSVVAELRRELDSTPEKFSHQREHIAARIETELVAIRAR